MTVLRFIVLAIAVPLASPIAAQPLPLINAMNAWTQQTGVYISGPAQRLLAEQLANQFSQQAPAAGFATSDANLVTKNIRVFGQNLNLTHEEIGTPSSSNFVQFHSEAQSQLVERIFSVPNISLYLQRFAVVQLNVQPVPPRDYSVSINGEPCPTTERALYEVPPGLSVISVTRPNAPNCMWQGQIAPGQTVVVPCTG